MQWEIIDTGVEEAETLMRKDAALLESLGERKLPIVHFYEWKNDSATYGYFIRPDAFLNVENAGRRGLDLARRPTGGGIVFHAWDWAFSVLVPASCPHFSMNTLENYAFINNAVLNAVKSFLKNTETRLTPDDSIELDAGCSRFCMAKPTKYDVMLKERKIAGAAQRKQKGGFLHQGTIALTMPPEEYLKDVLLPGTRVLEAMQAHTFPLLGAQATKDELQEARVNLKKLLRVSLERCDAAEN